MQLTRMTQQTVSLRRAIQSTLCYLSARLSRTLCLWTGMSIGKQ